MKLPRILGLTVLLAAIWAMLLPSAASNRTHAASNGDCIDANGNAVAWQQTGLGKTCKGGGNCTPLGCNNNCNVTCAGLTCTWCDWSAVVAGGGCGPGTYLQRCTYCPARLVCATGDSYEVNLCRNFCCAVYRAIEPNGCIP